MQKCKLIVSRAEMNATIRTIKIAEALQAPIMVTDKANLHEYLSSSIYN